MEVTNDCPFRRSTYSQKRYYAGKVNYDTVPLVVRDWVDSGTRKALVVWRKTVYDRATGAIGLPKTYKRIVSIILVSSDGSITRQCDLIGAWPSSMVGGTLDHTGSDQVKIEMTIRFDEVKWFSTVSV